MYPINRILKLHGFTIFSRVNADEFANSAIYYMGIHDIGGMDETNCRWVREFVCMFCIYFSIYEHL
jgi:hypothetical protein